MLEGLVVSFVVIYLVGVLIVFGSLRVRMRTRFFFVIIGLRRLRGFGDFCWGKGVRIFFLVFGFVYENIIVLVGICSLDCYYFKFRARLSF